ncbi:hypothetical protein [Caenispirillum bisanense]|uniref:hypothetical protein n=1 Tax=Caenispirillum bisanense TaxID=414052 RepID=UPI0031D6862E
MPFRPATLVAALGLPLLAAACSSAPDWSGWTGGGGADGSASLRGVLVLPDATPLPATARGEVRLIDLARSGPGRPFLLASHVVDGPLANPVPWQLRWREEEGAATGSAATYALTARLVGDGITLYHTPAPLPLTGMAGPLTVAMEAAPPPPDANRNRYSLESMPDVTQLRQMPQGEVPRRFEDDFYGYGATSSDPLPSDPLDGNRVLMPAQPIN